ncbi:MAG: SPFH domain-containing protein [Nanoarchaeota archaeon]|nr:SPFH domain-containing protein [Nanoarchaeota archaeon]MCG2719042.1 SPFH domain-containing protein [Nanoarchaeota archaeon]
MSLRKIQTYGKIAAGLAVWTMISLGALGGAATPFYRVKQEHGVVLTHFDGSRTIDADVGVHSRITSINPTKWVFTTREESMRVEYIHLDNDPRPHTMQAADKLTFQGSGVWTYEVDDLNKYGIKMGNKALLMLTEELNGIARAKIQSHPIEEIVTNLDAINKEIIESNDIQEIEGKYGIDILSFRMKHATYPSEMNEKAAKAKGVKIEAEAFDYAAGKIASGKKKISAADRQVLEDYINGSGIQTEEGRMKALEVMRDKNLYDMLKDKQGDTVYVIPHGNGSPNMTLPGKGIKSKVDAKIIPPQEILEDLQTNIQYRSR